MGISQNHQPFDQSADLGWLAYRYVAEELSADEVAAFELRLAEDQGAREAVAEAVELSAAVTLAIGEGIEKPEPVVCVAEARGFWSQKAWLQPAAWMTVGAAACLAAVLCFYQPASDENRTAMAGADAVQNHQQLTSGELAMVWAESRYVEGDEIDLANAVDSSGMDEHSEEVTDDPQVIAPGWLLAAVTQGKLTDDLHLSSDND